MSVVCIMVARFMFRGKTKWFIEALTGRVGSSARTKSACTRAQWAPLELPFISLISLPMLQP